jgi:hypothetical protein
MGLFLAGNTKAVKVACASVNVKRAAVVLEARTTDACATPTGTADMISLVQRTDGIGDIFEFVEHRLLDSLQADYHCQHQNGSKQNPLEREQGTAVVVPQSLCKLTHGQFLLFALRHLMLDTHHQPSEGRGARTSGLVHGRLRKRTRHAKAEVNQSKIRIARCCQVRRENRAQNSAAAWKFENARTSLLVALR